MKLKQAIRLIQISKELMEYDIYDTKYKEKAELLLYHYNMILYLLNKVDKK